MFHTTYCPPVAFISRVLQVYRAARMVRHATYAVALQPFKEQSYRQSTVAAATYKDHFDKLPVGLQWLSHEMP